MYTSVFLTLVAASLASAQSFVINSATNSLLAQCQPYRITWTGGVAPYFPTINSAGSQTDVLQRFDQTSETSELWKVNLPVGTMVTFGVTDSTGQSVYSAISSAIQAGTSTDCLNSSSSAAVGGASTAASSAASSASSSASSSSAPSSSAGTSTASRSSSSSSESSSTASKTTSAPASSNTSNKDNGAVNLRSGSALVAGLVGVVAAALI